MEREDQLASLISASSVKRLVTVCVSSVSPTEIWSLWSHHRPEFWRSIVWLETNLRSSDSSDSCGVFDVHLGLYPYFQDGGWFRLEIKVEFHEGAVPLSTLLVLDWHHLACFVSLVRCLSYLFWVHFFLRSYGGKFDGNYMFEANVREWRFVKSTRPHIDTK